MPKKVKAKNSNVRKKVRSDIAEAQTYGESNLENREFFADGGESINREGRKPGSSAFDAAGKRWFKTDPRDRQWERLKTLEAKGMLGPDKMFGARTYTPELASYMDDKEAAAMEARKLDLIMESFDERDLVQRSMLDRAFPEVKRDKEAMFEASMEQHAFLVKTAMAAPADLPDGAHTRLISIIGGAERLLVHPVSERIYSSNITSNAGAPLMTELGNSVLGLISFVASDARSDTEFKPGLAATENVREGIAREVLHHFPALMTGKLSSIESVRSKVDAEAAKRLRVLCERVVNENPSDWEGLDRLTNMPFSYAGRLG